MEVEVTEAQCNESIAKGHALENLYRNKDFQLIFVEGYFKQHILNLSSTLAHAESAASATSDGIATATIKNLAAVGMCKKYLEYVSHEAIRSEEAKNELKAEMDMDLQEQIMQGQFGELGE